MSQLIKKIEGHYIPTTIEELGSIEDKEPIPFNKLIPVSSWGDFPNNLEIASGVDFKKGEAVGVESDLRKKIKGCAEEYAEKMGCPYYELKFRNEVSPGGIFGTSYRKATVVISGQILLYTLNGG